MLRLVPCSGFGRAPTLEPRASLITTRGRGRRLVVSRQLAPCVLRAPQQYTTPPADPSMTQPPLQGTGSRAAAPLPCLHHPHHPPHLTRSHGVFVHIFLYTPFPCAPTSPLLPRCPAALLCHTLPCRLARAVVSSRMWSPDCQALQPPLPTHIPSTFANPQVQHSTPRGVLFWGEGLKSCQQPGCFWSCLTEAEGLLM